MELVSRLSRLLLGSLLVLQLCACAASRPAGTNRITADQIVLDQKDPLECAYLGNVTASGLAPEDSLKGLKTQALKRGGNHLVIIEALGVVGTRFLYGAVYRCPI